MVINDAIGWEIVDQRDYSVARCENESEARYIAACINRAPLLERSMKLLNSETVHALTPSTQYEVDRLCADYDAATKGGE